MEDTQTKNVTLEWTGVRNPNKQPTIPNQTTNQNSSWNCWNGMENTNNQTQINLTHIKGFGTNTVLQPETQTLPYPPAPMYHHRTHPSYSKVAQPTYSQTVPVMYPGAGIVMGQQGADSGNRSLMGPNMNRSYLINQIPHSQTQAQGAPPTQTQVLH